MIAGCDEYLKTALEFARPPFRRSKDAVVYFVTATTQNDAAPALREQCRQQLAIYSAQPAALPEEVRGLEADQYVILQSDAHEEFLTGGAELVDDPLASDGKAVRLAKYLSAAKWFTRARFTGKWRCYVQVRSDATEMTDNAFELQTFDMFIWPYRSTVQEVVPLKEVNPDAYQTYDLGVHELKSGVNLRFRLTSNIPFYVDRVFLVRADSE